MEQFIKTPLRIFESPIFLKHEAFIVYMHCLSRARWQDEPKHIRLATGKGHTVVTINRGQLITGAKTTSADCGLSPSMFRRMLKYCQKYGELKVESKTHYSIVTVTYLSENESSVQKVEQPMTNQCRTNEQPLNKQRKTNEQPLNTNIDSIDIKEPIKQIKPIEEPAPEKKQLEIVQLNAAQNTPPLPGGGEIFEEVEEVEVEHLDELPLHIAHANKIKAYFCDYEQARLMICQSARWEGSMEQFNAEVDKFAAYYANERQHHLERCADNPRRYAGAALQRWLSQSKTFNQSKYNNNGNGKQQIVKGASKEEQRQSIAEYLRNRRADG